MASEVEDTLKRIQSHRGVIGTIVVNNEGVYYFIKCFLAQLCITLEFVNSIKNLHGLIIMRLTKKTNQYCP